MKDYNKTTKKREPADPYECWSMPCKECVFFNEETKECSHPEAYQNLIRN